MGAYFGCQRRFVCCGPDVNVNDDEEEEFARTFKARTGISPEAAWRRLLFHLGLWIFAGTFMAMTGVEYTRYYVSNNLTEVAFLNTVTGQAEEKYCNTSH